MRRRQLCLAAVLLAPPRALGAQVLLSEHGSVAQTVDGTTITVEYFRPVARGRDSLFGRVVRWGEMWTPGANWATTLDVDHDVRVNGNRLPKGKYSVWMVPRPDTAWTVAFSRDWHTYHTDVPDRKDEQLRFTARPETGPHMETLTWYFPLVTRDGATLRMHWGTTFLPLRVTVTPSQPAPLAAAERGTYAGSYRVRSTDAADPDFGTIEVVESDGQLHARASRPLWGYDAAFDLVPFGGRKFRPSFYLDGKPWGMEADVVFAFRMDGRHASGFEMLGPYGKSIARGELVR